MPDIQSAVGEPRDVRDDADGDLFMILNEEGRAALADEAWMFDQLNRGLLVQYRGEYIAIVNKEILGHNKSLRKLREDVSRESGHSIDRIVTFFVDGTYR